MSARLHGFRKHDLPGLPDNLAEYLESLLCAGRAIAYLQLDAHGGLASRGGEVGHFGLDAIGGDAPVVDQLDFLHGSLPLPTPRCALPLINLPNGSIADVHLCREQDEVWALFLDSRVEAEERQKLQQHANDLWLLRKQQERLLAQIRRSNQDLQAILNQLLVTTAIVESDGAISFLSEAGHKLLLKDRSERIVGAQWEDILPLAARDKERIRRALSLPAAARERLRLHGEIAPDQPFSIELDIQDDPRDPARKMFFLYDVTEVHDLRRQLDEKEKPHVLIGRSGPMEAVFELIRDLAAVDSTVLIEGETGTGKELVARAIHRLSARKDRPFVAVNCAGLVDSLLNSQLFGHRKGAFTGAVADQIGVFEAADNGTLFLDEIGDIPANVQTRILRVLEEREITRVGETKTRRVDVRIIAATNRDLQREVDQGRFRLDLLYRIRVARIAAPPLRDRGPDIALLADAFLQESRTSTGKAIRGFSAEALQALTAWNWPGNVREMRNAVEFAAICCKGPLIQLKDLPPEMRTAPCAATATEAPEDCDEKRRTLLALQQAGGNRKAAAQLLGIGRATLYRRMDRFGISDK